MAIVYKKVTKKTKKKRNKDRYMQMLWRQAVLKFWGMKCVFCGNPDILGLEAHHLVKRKNKILRHDYRNGIPLCKYGCHAEADTLEGMQKIQKIVPKAQIVYLKTFEKMNYKDFLIDRQMTNLEYMKEMKQELNEFIKSND
ncbi:MAG: HNH endonuclease [Thermoplasmatales archaeon]|nr:MAG: HNH endonuclease [Thermoplasmatales archaeon]